MRNPCLSCDRREKSKNHPRCRQCEERDAYVQSMAGPAALGPDKTNLTGQMNGYGGHNMGGENVSDNKKRPLPNQEHWEFVDQRRHEMGVSSEALFNYSLKNKKIVDARATLLMEMVDKFQLTLTDAADEWRISLNTAINWKKRSTALKSAAPAPEKKEAPDSALIPAAETDPDQALSVIFADHPEVLELAKKAAQTELRTTRNQVVYCVKNWIEESLGEWAGASAEE